jgi:cobalt-zinc-cadmium efflux system outer membrane protein
MRHFCSLILLALPLTAWAQTAALTEGEALRLGLARSALSDLERGALGAAEADAQAAATLPNPTLAYGRQRMRSDPVTVEETWMLEQAFDVSGRRGLRREAAERRVDAVHADNALRRGEAAADIRRRFHELLLKQETVRATETWLARFARIDALVGKLARAGEVSGYDSRRLARERRTAEIRLAQELAEQDRVRERLAALIGKPGESIGRVDGRLLPPPPPKHETALAGLAQRPNLQALSRRAEAADLEGRAATRGWVPDVTLGIGTKRADTGFGHDHGTLFSVSIPLPLFDRQQAGERRAAAEALHARAEHALTRARAEGELRGLQRQAERLTAAAADYRARAAGESAELLRIAEAAYRGGESSLLELLDAYRGALDTELIVLDLEWKARQARIDYDLLTGSPAE